jgi:hypothetical protein
MTPSAAMSDLGGRIYHRLLTAAALSATHKSSYTLTSTCGGVGGRGLIKRCHILTVAALSSCSYVIRIVISLPISPSVAGRISLTAVRKKMATVPQGEGFVKTNF